LSAAKRGWAAFETGISRPCPRSWIGRCASVPSVPLKVCPPINCCTSRSRRVAVDYATGQIVDHQELPTSTPPRTLGRYPHAAAAKIPGSDWHRVWDELFGLYPEIITVFAGQAAPGQCDKVARFAELFELTVPPFMKSTYQALNPAFFEWLKRASHLG